MTIQKKNIIQKTNIKEKMNNCELFFFIEFFLYLQCFLIKCRNFFLSSFYIKDWFFIFYFIWMIFLLLYIVFICYYTKFFRIDLTKNFHITQWFHIKTQNLFSISTCWMTLWWTICKQWTFIWWNNNDKTQNFDKWWQTCALK